MFISSNDDVVDVPVGESRVSTNKIKTDHLGPCLGFLIDFKFNGEDRCTLFHYSFFINEENFKTESELLVQILYYIAAELQYCLEIDGFKSNGKICLSNIRLLIAGGAIQTSQRIENVLSMLNSGVNFNIQQLTDDEELLFLHNELINNILIIKPVSKMLSNSEEAAAIAINQGNDFPYVCLEFSCKTKDIMLSIKWFGSDLRLTFGLLKFNMNDTNISNVRWNIYEQIINDLKIYYTGDEAKLRRIQEALELIDEQPFILCPVCNQ